jgi:hypothetical protein
MADSLHNPIKDRSRLMTDRSQYKLGKKDFKFDSRTLKLRDYLVPTLPAPPASINWAPNVTSWPMLMNDTLGDCTIAAALHAVQVWMLSQGKTYTPTDAIALEYYEKWDGYVNGDPNTDNGGDETTVLTRWKAHNLNTHVLRGWVDPQPGNQTHIMQSIAYFGGVYIGLQLPVSAQNQTEWTVVANDGGVWGGHAVYCYAYNSTGPICATWNEVMQMTWGFWDKYCDEAHCLLGAAWAPGVKDVIKYSQFEADLALVSG